MAPQRGQERDACGMPDDRAEAKQLKAAVQSNKGSPRQLRQSSEQPAQAFAQPAELQQL